MFDGDAKRLEISITVNGSIKFWEIMILPSVDGIH